MRQFLEYETKIQTQNLYQPSETTKLIFRKSLISDKNKIYLRKGRSSYAVEVSDTTSQHQTPADGKIKIVSCAKHTREDMFYKLNIN